MKTKRAHFSNSSPLAPGAPILINVCPITFYQILAANTYFSNFYIINLSIYMHINYIHLHTQTEFEVHVDRLITCLSKEVYLKLL